MKNLIIGAGEVGQGLFEIFKRHHETYIRDIVEPGEIHPHTFDVIHIAFPDSPKFISHVVDYVDEYKPQLTIIHSSVVPGTTEKCGEHVVYSPVRGRHNGVGLHKEMRQFKKFVAGFDMNDVDRACAFFESCKWQTQAYDNPKTLEQLKLLSNIHMGLEIAWRQEIERMGVNAEAYQLWEDDYFRGYLHLGQHHLIRPRMRPDPIGGHCILECTKLLKSQYPSKAFDFILESNEKAKEEALCQTK